MGTSLPALHLRLPRDRTPPRPHQADADLAAGRRLPGGPSIEPGGAAGGGVLRLCGGTAPSGTRLAHHAAHSIGRAGRQQPLAVRRLRRPIGTLAEMRRAALLLVALIAANLWDVVSDQIVRPKAPRGDPRGQNRANRSTSYSRRSMPTADWSITGCATPSPAGTSPRTSTRRRLAGGR